MTQYASPTTGTIARASQAWRSAFKRGIDDYERGRPFYWLYDDWPLVEQLGYEQGRLLAAAASAAGTRVPPWNGSQYGAWEVEIFALDLVTQHGRFLPEGKVLRDSPRYYGRQL